MLDSHATSEIGYQSLLNDSHLTIVRPSARGVGRNIDETIFWSEVDV
jgi:hypothetical protein